MDWSVTRGANNEVFGRFAAAIKALPRQRPLQRADLLVARFKLHSEPHLEIYYAPLDYVNEGARVALVGITPGWAEMERSFSAARDAFQTTSRLDEAAKQSKYSAGFAGKMRETLNAWLDAIELPLAVGVQSSAELFGDHRSLLHITSVIRYPVFVNGNNYSGHAPRLLRHPVLTAFVDDPFGPEIRRIRDALVIPLGAAANEALLRLIQRGFVERSRCLLDFPHPSHGKGFEERRAKFNRIRPELANVVRAWAATH